MIFNVAQKLLKIYIGMILKIEVKCVSLMWRRHNSLRMREYGELKNLMQDMVRMTPCAPTIALKFVPAVEP